MTGVTLNCAALVAVPPGVVAAMFPVMAPIGTVAVNCVSEFTVKLVAATPPKVILLVCVNPVPVITTAVPTGPLVGLNPVRVVSTTVKAVVLVAEPQGVVTAILPVMAPAGTVAVTWVSEFTAKVVAVTPPKATLLVPVKPEPVITTCDPETPLVGVKPDTNGVTRNGRLLVSVPVDVVTVTKPVVAPAGIVAVR
jgi:hypothetical protein